MSLTHFFSKLFQVFLPYNYLLDDRIRRSLPLPLRGACAIVDEAHNLGQVCEDVASLTFTPQVRQRKSISFLSHFCKNLVESLVVLQNYEKLFAGHKITFETVRVNSNDQHSLGPFRKLTCE